jgi:hypothetical protein
VVISYDAIVDLAHGALVGITDIYFIDLGFWMGYIIYIYIYSIFNMQLHCVATAKEEKRRSISAIILSGLQYVYWHIIK